MCIRDRYQRRVHGNKKVMKEELDEQHKPMYIKRPLSFSLPALQEDQARKNPFIHPPKSKSLKGSSENLVPHNVIFKDGSKYADGIFNPRVEFFKVEQPRQNITEMTTTLSDQAEPLPQVKDDVVSSAIIPKIKKPKKLPTLSLSHSKVSKKKSLLGYYLQNSLITRT
eukprot:TRINITY_DN6804_c0_g1_i2.p1 TRINITY_DN6804_c0_g1~~TRINITY_DN6804_c0_g1_i2.p1  ORF type:complete len:168 (+),score=28.28 TRINITY_DN6804_c0_g1_i2:158-661(+)